MKNFLQLITIVCFVFPSILFAQNTKYRNSHYDWPPVPPKVQIEDRYKNEDAVIVAEETNIEMVHDKMSPYNYYITKEMRIRYQTEASLIKYNTITLPESFDPLSDYSKVPMSKRDSLHRPKGSFDFLLAFNARIIKPDGSVVIPDIEESKQVEMFPFNAIEKRYYSVRFVVTNLNINDELHIRYRCKEEVDNTLHFNYNEHDYERVDKSHIPLTPTYIAR